MDRKQTEARVRMELCVTMSDYFVDGLIEMEFTAFNLPVCMTLIVNR
jgi:hypothetical protein